MASINIVPWFNAAQFKKVYNYLYSDEITKKKWAIDTISVWETRCHPSLPTAIEATYVLTSAVVQDILWTNKSSLIHHTDLQGIYGSAITRFVSLSVEVNKNKDIPKYSIAEVAKSIGIPSFIVDIRNELCHSSRPSLAVLRLAAQSALKYLKESYWEKEAALVNNYIKQPQDETELHMLFTEFIEFHDDTMKTPKVKVIKSEDGTVQINPKYLRLLKNLEKYLRMNKRLFVKVLVSDGIFIPTDDGLKHMISDEEYTLFNNEYYLEDDDDEDEEDEEMSELSNSSANNFFESYQFEAKCLPEVPEYHENLWEQIIIMLNTYDAVPLFMEELLKTQGNRTTVGQKLLVGWMLKILRIHSPLVFAVKSRRLKRTFRHKGIVPNWLSMLHSAVINPCKYSLMLLPLIISNLDLEKEVVHRIIGLASLKLGLAPVRDQDKKYCKLFHTAKDLKQAFEFQNSKQAQKYAQKQRRKEQPPENIWSPCPDDCHKLWPIGFIVNAVRDKEEDEEEVIEEIFECSRFFPSFSNGFGERMLSSNKNDDDDDDDDDDDLTCKMNEEPDLSKIMMDIERRETVLYKRSG